METPKLQGQEGETSYGYHLRIAPSTRHPPAPATQGLLCHSTKEGGICFHCSKLHLFPHSSMFVQIIPPRSNSAFLLYQNALSLLPEEEGSELLFALLKDMVRGDKHQTAT